MVKKKSPSFFHSLSQRDLQKAFCSVKTASREDCIITLITALTLDTTGPGSKDAKTLLPFALLSAGLSQLSVVLPEDKL